MNLGTRLAYAIVTHEKSLTPAGREEETIVPAKVWQQLLDLATAELRRRRRAQAIGRVNSGSLPARTDE